MMTIENVIENLCRVDGPSKELDAAIAALFVSSNVKPVRTPEYTANLQDAWNLANELAPEETIGLSWASGEPAHAKIGEARPVQSSLPAIALCAAALLHLRRQRILADRR